MTTGTSIIELKDVSFSYDGSGEPAREKALDQVSLSICEGDFVGVIGPSGAGKSTLAAVMSGAIPHHFTGQLFGATFVDGRDTCFTAPMDNCQFVETFLTTEFGGGRHEGRVAKIMAEDER